MKHLLSIIIFFSFISFASADECSIQIEFDYSDGGAPIWLLADNDDGIISGKSTLVTTIHPSYGEIEKKAIIIEGNICYDYLSEFLINDKIDNNSSNSISKMQLLFPTDDEACRTELLNAFKPNQEMSIKVDEIFEGHTAHHATHFLIHISNMNINNKWICNT